MYQLPYYTIQQNIQQLIFALVYDVQHLHQTLLSRRTTLQCVMFPLNQQKFKSRRNSLQFLIFPRLVETVKKIHYIFFDVQ